MKTRKSETFQI